MLFLVLMKLRWVVVYARKNTHLVVLLEWLLFQLRHTCPYSSICEALNVPFMLCALLNLHPSLAPHLSEPNSRVQFPGCFVTMYWHVLKIRKETLHLLRFSFNKVHSHRFWFSSVWPINQVLAIPFQSLCFYSLPYWIFDAGVHNLG